MSEERGSSGTGTVMIVVAILGGLLLVGCCGGLAVVGAAFFSYRSAVDVEMEVMRAQETSQQSLQKAQSEVDERMGQELESLRIPVEPSVVQPPDSAPADPPSLSPEKDE